MLRLAIRGSELDSIADRLHGAMVATHPPGADIALATCDAVALLELRPDDEALVERCLAAGKHVLLTAPTALSGRALERLGGLAECAGVQLALLNPARFVPSRLLIRQELDAGHLGEPGLVRIHHWHGAGSSDAHAALLALSDLDLAMWLMGRTPNVIYSLETTSGEGCTGEGWSVHLHLGFAGGPMALIDCVAFAEPGEGYQSLTVIGSTGAAYADDRQNVQLLYRGGQPRASRVSEGQRERLALVQEFVCSMERGDDLSFTVPAWRQVMAVADAAKRSAALHEAVQVEGY
jgi:predicted dehydrogenase